MAKLILTGYFKVEKAFVSPKARGARAALRAIDHEVLPDIPKKGAADVQVAVGRPLGGRPRR